MQLPPAQSVVSLLQPVPTSHRPTLTLSDVCRHTRCVVQKPVSGISSSLHTLHTYLPFRVTVYTLHLQFKNQSNVCAPRFRSSTLLQHLTIASPMLTTRLSILTTHCVLFGHVLLHTHCKRHFEHSLTPGYQPFFTILLLLASPASHHVPFESQCLHTHCKTTTLCPFVLIY